MSGPDPDATAGRGRDVSPAAPILAHLPAEDLAHFADEIARLDFDAATAARGGNDYCVTCTGSGPQQGTRHTVHAGNGVFAFALAFRICGAGFSITKGRCP